MSEKLEKCPFCGGEPSIAPTIEQVEHDSWVASINCDSCDVSLTPQYTSPSQGEAVSDAIAAWNRRELESASQPGGGWQPIETAPKDGTRILARNDSYGARETYWRLYGDGSIAKQLFTQGKGPDGSWEWSEPQNIWASSWLPTHWMLLPSAPSAAPSAGNGGAEGVSVASLLKHEATAAPSDTVSRRDVDELVAPTAVRANEVDPKVINSGLDGVKGDLDAAANASPHDGLRADGSGLHDRQSAKNNPATHDAENTAVITADFAENSSEVGHG